MPMNRLLYVSRCALEEQGAERDAKVRALAAEAARRNAAAMLSGSLLYVNDSFVQVLEGPGRAVEQTFEAICCDFRHDDVKLIDLVPIKERIFSDWSLAFLSVDAETQLKTRDDMEEIRFLVGVNAREAVSQMRQLLRSDVVS
jgi:hypothetical protein